MNTTIQFRIDKKTKTQAQKTLRAMGLGLSTGLKMFLDQVIKEEALPFRPSKDPKKIRAEWDREVAHALKYGKRYTSTKEMFDDILKD